MIDPMVIYALAAFCIGAYLLSRVAVRALIRKAERAAFYRRTGFYIYR